MYASRTAVTAFRQAWNQQPGASQAEYEPLDAYWRLLWSYYTNDLLDSPEWTALRDQSGHYKETRPIYNPARRLVDFYAGVVYPGALRAPYQAADPMQHSYGIPLAAATPQPLQDAIATLWQWSNWQAGKHLLVRYGAATGNVLIEVEDDLDAGKVNLILWWPGMVSELSLDRQGNVKAYAIEYDYYDAADQKEHTYRRVVTPDAIATFRDDLATAYNEIPPEIANPYGFAPACWVKHTDTGSDYGAPCLRNLGKIDELNSLAAHALDQNHKVLGSPILIAGENIHPLNQPPAAAPPRPEGTRSGAVYTQPPDKDTLDFLRAAANSTVDTLRLDPGEALANLDHLLLEIERDHPELAMYTQMRGMTQVTGPAAERLFGDVAAYVGEARSNYDNASVKAFQMGTAIGGWRANSGAWGPAAQLTNQQAAFLPFDLDSYKANQLNVQIAPRPLFALSRQEEIAIEREALLLERLRAENAGLGVGPAAGIAERIRVLTPGALTPSALPG